MFLNPLTIFDSRIQNRLAHITFVGGHRASVVQQHRLAEEPHQVGSASGGVGTMAHRAAVLLKALFARRGQRSVHPARRPAFVVRRVHHHHLAHHSRMLRTAILRAEQVIAPRHRGMKPSRGVAPRQHIGFDAEGGNEEAVNHVLRGHDHAHVAAHRNVQFVDLALPLRVLELPHPLLADGSRSPSLPWADASA